MCLDGRKKKLANLLWCISSMSTVSKVQGIGKERSIREVPNREWLPVLLRIGGKRQFYRHLQRVRISVPSVERARRLHRSRNGQLESSEVIKAVLGS